MGTAGTVSGEAMLGESHYRQVFEHAGVVLIAVDRDLLITAWNQAASRAFGAAVSRMIGSPVGSILPHDRRHAAEALLRAAVDSGETSELSFHDRDAHGAPRELLATISPIASASGETVGASLCIRDITRRITAENELHQYRKMAALGEMAGAIAHHFNNTLGGVITSIDFANDADDPEVRDRVLGQIQRALTRVTALVNGLLAFAEGYQRADDLADLTEILNEVADDIDRETEGQEIRLTLDLPQLPVLPLPRTQMQTVLRNITQNAIEAMPNGGDLTIRVELTADQLVVRVSDTGTGLSDEAMSRLFQPFFSTKQRLASGGEPVKGLGLAVAHGIMQVLGGTITATSTAGQGSCFVISMPRPGTSR